MTKVLITGGAGYIGSHTCVELLNAGRDIVVIDNLRNSNQESLKRIKEITGKNFIFDKCDILDTPALEKVIKENDVSSIIHFAGLKAVGESVKQPIDYYLNNVVGTHTLLTVLDKLKVKNFVFSSSATVYGDPQFLPLTENHPLSTTNPYGGTKLIIENMLRDIHFSDDDWRISILRYFNPCGAHESGRIGEAPNGIPNNLMPYVAQVAVGRRDKLSIYGNDYDTPDGTGVRDYIHVVDLAKAHVKALNFIEKTSGCTEINLGTGKGYSVLDIVETFSKACGKDIPYTIVDRRPGDIASCYADPSHAKTLLGWTAERNLDDMCNDNWKWQKLNPNGYISNE